LLTVRPKHIGTWKGGPRLQGEPGTPEFIASYNKAAAQKVRAPEGRLLSLLQAYQASDDFRQLAPRTRDDYAGIIEKVIEPEYSDLPLSGLADKRTIQNGLPSRYSGWRTTQDFIGYDHKAQHDYLKQRPAGILGRLMDSVPPGARRAQTLGLWA
jgi:hypothetical protein